jgi:hypothetical protein
MVTILVETVGAIETICGYIKNA